MTRLPPRGGRDLSYRLGSGPKATPSGGSFRAALRFLFGFQAFFGSLRFDVNLLRRLG